MPQARTSAPRVSPALRRALAREVLATAAAVQRAQARLRVTDIVRKGVGDFVTVADLRAEARLRRVLRRLVPDAGFLGEESDPAELQRPAVWVVDPIDGTSNYANGLPHFAVSVALLWRGQPVLACVHCAPEQALYVAQHGRGAVRNGRRVRTPAGRFDDGAMFGCQWFRGQQQLAFLARLQQRGGRIRTFGSTVTQLADVAVGRLHANVQEQGRIWDLAAAGLLVVEAGCRFTDWHGEPLLPFRRLEAGHLPSLAAPPRVHRAVRALLRT